MPHYRIANLPIDSAIALPSPRASSGRRGGWRFRISRGRVPPAPRAWYHHELDDEGGRWRSLARAGDGHVIRFPGQATFVASFAERTVTCYPAASASVDLVRQLFVGHVLPLVLAARGALALHASAVRTRHGVLAFVGETRRGKSTIAAALAALGCPLVADDCAIVDVAGGGCRVRAMNVGLRLWPDTLRTIRHTRTTTARPPGLLSKTRIAAATLGLPVQHRPAPLHRVYLLDPSACAAVTIEPVSPPDAVVALLRATFQLGMDETSQLRNAFENLSAVAARVPVRRLGRPAGLRHLPLLVERVLEDAGAVA